MPKFRNVFFSFHYADVMLASIIRKCDQFFPDRMSFRDWPDWESVRLRDDKAIMDWIDGQLEGTSVTAVLIGAQTYSRRWVNYEITKSIERGNGIVGIYLNRMRGPRHTGTAHRGPNPFLLHPARSTPAVRRGGVIDSLMHVGLDSLPPHSPPMNALAGLLASSPPPQNALAGLLASARPANPGLFASAPHSSSPGLIESMLGARKTGLGFASPPEPPPNALLGMYGLGEHAIQSNPPNLAAQVDCYCWEGQSGHYNVADWIEKAAREAGR